MIGKLSVAALMTLGVVTALVLPRAEATDNQQQTTKQGGRGPTGHATTTNKSVTKG
jgi:hypothetical protein